MLPVVAFATWKFVFQRFSLKLFRSPSNFITTSLSSSPVKTNNDDQKMREIIEKVVGTGLPAKMSYLLSQTITVLTRHIGYTDKLEGLTRAQKLALMPTGNAPVCFDHFLMTPDNQGGVYIIGEWRSTLMSAPGRESFSLIHYKANGTNEHILDLKETTSFVGGGLYGMALNSSNNLYIGRWTWSKDEAFDRIEMLVGRIVDFPNNKKLEPYLGLTSDFRINLLDFCSEVPELCKGGKLSTYDLFHLSVDAKDNLYLAFMWPKPTVLVDGYPQVTVLKITPSEKVVRVGSFPHLSIDPKTNRFIALHSVDRVTREVAVAHDECSLAVDQSDNVFIHNENVLFQFESTPQGYGPVKIVAMLNKEYCQRSIAFHPEGGIVALKSQEYSIWQMAPGFIWELFLGLPHEPVFQLGTAQQTRFKNPREMAYDRAGRLFVFDSGSDAIVVYK